MNHPNFNNPTRARPAPRSGALRPRMMRETGSFRSSWSS